MHDFPTLRILPVDKLVVHEKHDHQRTAPLIANLRASGVLRNPTIVISLRDGSGRFMVLDGANRTAAMLEMGLPHTLAQVVEADSPRLDLRTWNHVLWGLEPEAFLEGLRGIPDLQTQTVDEEATLEQLWQQQILVWLQTPDGGTLVTTTPSKDLQTRIRMLNAIADSYKDRTSFDRTRVRQIAALEGIYDQLCAIVVYPPFKIAEVLEACSQGELFPAGVTRFTVSPRALRVNYPLEELASKKSPQEKNAHLEAWLQARISEKGVRFYAEATVLYDE